MATSLRDRIGARRRAARQRGRYAAFQEEVEPGLRRRPRLHRFGVPPVVWEPRAAREPVAVCVDPAGGGDAEVTLASLREQTVRPADIVQTPLGEALSRTRAPWVLRVPAGDRLSAIALERLGQAARLAPDAALISCDEDGLKRAGGRERPLLRPGPSPELALGIDPFGPALCVRREDAAAAPAAPSDAGAEAARYRLALALAGPDGDGHAHVPLVLAHRSSGARSAPPDLGAIDVVREELAARGETGAVVEELGPGRRRVRRALGAEPTVQAIVCFRDRAELVERCARSLLDVTDWERLSLRLVDNGSERPETLELLGRLGRDPRVTIRRDPRPFNFSALNNASARESDADVLLFLNNDTEVQESGWLAELLEEALRPEVGAVGPLLLYPSGYVQHAGVALGVHGWAGHPFAGLRPEAPTPFGTAAAATRNWLAVTGACLLVERAKFERAGGWDEGFAVGGGDVDLCLRLTAAGHRSVCLPHVAVVHHEGQSRERHIDPGDFERSRERYGPFRTLGDPFYNPALTLADTSCSLRAPEEEEEEEEEPS